MTARDLLRLARFHGIAAAYTDGLGARRRASSEILESLLRGLGVDPADPGRTLDHNRREQWSELCEPVAVAWDGVGELLVRAPEATRSRLRIDVACEDGSARSAKPALAEVPILERLEAGRRTLVARRVPLPALPLGYHRATVRLGSRAGTALVIAAPRSAPVPPRHSREFGIVAPLYSLRSQLGHGIADLSDLRRLLSWMKEGGGSFVGTLPLLAAFLDEPAEISPYLPASRLAWNELYLDVTATPEWAHAAEARWLLDAPNARRERTRLGRRALADPAAAYALKRPAIEALAATLFAGRGERRGAIERFARERPEIAEYARFRAAGERLGRPWQAWPQRARDGRLQDADVPRDAYRYHLYAQFALHEQLAALCAEARADGPGLYLDLPVGGHGSGFDTWRDQVSFAPVLGVGAPPDRVFEGGQSWGLPPLHPERLRRQGYRHFIEVVRNHLRYAGVLRLDHVMGLERLYVIPPGASARDGAYLHYRADELFAILTLEATRAGSLLVGEDLGTVTRSVRAAMRRHGVGRMHVVEFAARPGGDPLVEPPPRGSLATLSTHDLPPLAGWVQGTDVAARRRLGFIDEQRERSDLVARGRAVGALRRFLDLLPRAGDTHDLLLASLRHLGESEAPLVAVALDDLVGSTEAQNLPGTVDEHPNWRRRTERRRDTLEQPALREAVAALSATRASAVERP